jgi:uncharacterized protein (UPF0332 family)
VTPEAADYLAKAHDDLREAQIIASVGLAQSAARSAYYAVFHAAEALIVNRTGKIIKTHSGVRAEFARLARDIPELDRSFSAFLAESYKYKQISDYGVGPMPPITAAEAERTLESAKVFTEAIARLVSDKS